MESKHETRTHGRLARIVLGSGGIVTEDPAGNTLLNMYDSMVSCDPLRPTTLHNYKQKPLP